MTQRTFKGTQEKWKYKADGCALLDKPELGRELRRTAQQDIFKEAFKHPKRFDPPVDVTLLFSLTNGRTQTTHPDPGGASLGKTVKIGARTDLKKVELAWVSRPNDERYTIDLICHREEERFTCRYHFVRKDGVWVVQTELERQHELFRDALKNPVKLDPPQDISLLYELAAGASRKIHPAPDGGIVAASISIGAKKELTAVELQEVVRKDDGNFAITVICHKESRRFLCRYSLCRKDGAWVIQTELERQREILASALENPGTLNTPQDISCLYRLKKAAARIGHPLPDKSTSKGEVNIGGRTRVRKIELLGTAKVSEGRYIINVLCHRKEGVPFQCQYNLLQKNGVWIVQSEINRQKNLLLEALKRPGLCAEPQAISLLFKLAGGKARMCHPTPEGGTLRAVIAIGVRRTLSKIELEGVKQISPKRYSIRVKCHAGSHSFPCRYYLIKKDRAWTVESEQSRQRRVLADALLRPRKFKRPPDISFLYDRRSGNTKMSHPALDRSNIGVTRPIGAGGGLHSVKLLETWRYKDAVGVAVRCRYKKDGSERTVKYLVRGKEVVPLGGDPKKGCLEKAGLILDAALRQELGPRHSGGRREVSALTGESRDANFFLREQQIVGYAKWGRLEADIVETALKLSRLQSFVTSDSRAVLALYHDENADFIQECVAPLAGNVAIVGIEPLLEQLELEAFQSERTKRILRQTETALSLGDEDFLDDLLREVSGGAQNGHHEAAGAGDLLQERWKESLIESLKNNASGVIAALEKHIRYHSPLWEETYHLRLISHLSYALNVITWGDGAALRETLQHALCSMYPEVRLLDSAESVWKRILERLKERAQERSAADYVAEPLQPFSLLSFLGMPACNTELKGGASVSIVAFKTLRDRLQITADPDIRPVAYLRQWAQALKNEEQRHEALPLIAWHMSPHFIFAGLIPKERAFRKEMISIEELESAVNATAKERCVLGEEKVTIAELQSLLREIKGGI